ncbi:hypothetical protein [Streptomyces sp. Ac-502]|uniref:hypothetical protein n=1 Tax=Streptomyces sp. Ac-502 TaxID=3342801 RepID=UPI0038628C28
MSTATRPLPPHGERRCYLRGCRRPECRSAQIRYLKQYRLDRERDGLRRTDATGAAARVRALIEAGWSHRQIAAASGCSCRAIASLALGEHATIHATLAARIIAARPTLALCPPASYVSALGARRRVRALMAIGHTRNAIAAAVSITPGNLSILINEQRPKTIARHAQAIAAIYPHWAMTPGSDTRARLRAQREGWAPPAAWSDDTIDDPSAHPDWTGHCGSDRGWWLHRIHELPLCAPCEAAHRQWLDEHRNLPRGERARAMGLARAAASNRGPATAENIRELLALGHDVEQAAERLGITTSYLHQTLARYPEIGEAA